MIFTMVSNNKRKKLIKEEDKNIINEFLNNKYLDTLDNEYIDKIDDGGSFYLHDEIASIESLCYDYLKGKKKITYNSKTKIREDIKELNSYIQEHKIIKYKNIPTEMEKVFDTIFKYYDENGDWKQNTKQK